jgi:hypothetical protein
MTYPPQLAAAGVLSVLLAGVLVWQIAAPAEHAVTIEGVVAARPAPPIALARPRDSVVEREGDLLARPLFNASRRSASRPEAVAEDLPRLAGLLVSPSGARAIFVPPSGPALVAVAGDRVGGYVVKSISGRDITLTGPGGERVLRPTFARQDPNRKGDAAVAAPARPASAARGANAPGLILEFPKP